VELVPGRENELLYAEPSEEAVTLIPRKRTIHRARTIQRRRKQSRASDFIATNSPEMGARG
jgi:hypothetical protein